jgi:hypothetical protein
MEQTWARRITAQAVAMVAPLAMLTALPSAASADDAGGLRVESYVLPAGAVKPSLEELQNGDGLARLRELAATTEPQARMPLETVGPAASYAPLSQLPSGAPPTEGKMQSQPASAVGPRATAPEPARTMSFEECRKGLGSDKKFFVKSRFAVCNGASFT